MGDERAQERRSGEKAATTVRARTEAWERQNLAPWACRSSESKGRERPGGRADELRTDFQRDRDRIIHSKAFRRLAHKTQVFLAPEGDHYRTRLTHTLEVAQIARTIARALELNEDLTEAIALGHDLGHTPFGHVGEDALTECLQESAGRFQALPEGFRHHEQSVRVVERLEYAGAGLNLTWEVRDGIGRHSFSTPEPATAEGRVVRVADKIAYVSHDLDDAERAGVLETEDIPAELRAVLGSDHAARLNTMITDLVSASQHGEIRQSERVGGAMMELRRFLFEHVYTRSPAKRENPKAVAVLKALFSYFLEHPEEMPLEHGSEADEPLPVRVCDYISGMTDRYAIGTFERLFVPQPWALHRVEDSD